MTRRKFSHEFKIEGVKLVTERSVSAAQACRDLELAEGVSRRWMREAVCAATLPAFHKVEAIAQTPAAAHLDEGWLSSNPDYLARAGLLLRIAADFSPPDAAGGMR